MQDISHQMLRRWQAIIAPPPGLDDPVRRSQIRLLNSILVVFIPLAVIILLLQVTILGINQILESTTIKAITMGIGVALIIYRINHTRYHRFGRWLTILIGFVTILVNAVASSPPHLEILYLIMLPLVGMLILSLREAAVVSAFTIIALALFTFILGDIPTEIFKDVITFMIFVEVFILFLNRQRNQLELDRQSLAVEQGRGVLLKQLISSLSHDFRTPLTVIVTNVYLISRAKTPAEQHERLQQIHRQALRLTRMIDDILTMSALDHRDDQSLERVNVNSVLQTIYDQFQAEAREKGIHLRLSLDESLRPVPLNPDNLRRALASLVENALSYNTPGGHVTLRSGSDPQGLLIEVVDTGIGIAPANLDAVFTPFFRADPSRPTDTGGMGLGLAIARRIIELHGGTLTVESVPGQGSAFRVRLPDALTSAAGS
jgi:signal transduction histidine kinase